MSPNTYKRVSIFSLTWMELYFDELQKNCTKLKPELGKPSSRKYPVVNLFSPAAVTQAKLMKIPNGNPL